MVNSKCVASKDRQMDGFLSTDSWSSDHAASIYSILFHDLFWKKLEQANF